MKKLFALLVAAGCLAGFNVSAEEDDHDVAPNPEVMERYMHEKQQYLESIAEEVIENSSDDISVIETENVMIDKVASPLPEEMKEMPPVAAIALPPEDAIDENEEEIQTSNIIQVEEEEFLSDGQDTLTR